jgi:hypothetical protein
MGVQVEEEVTGVVVLVVVAVDEGVTVVTPVSVVVASSRHRTRGCSC